MQSSNLNSTLDHLDKFYRQEPASIPYVANDDEGVILYGAGNLGNLAFDFLQHVGVRVKYAIDRAASSGMILAPGVKVYSLNNAPRHETSPILVSTVNGPFTSIKKDLSGRGWRQILPFYDYAQHYATKHPLNNGWFAGPLSVEDQAGIESVLHLLADANSRAAYLQFLAWRILREDWFFDEAPVIEDDRFFIRPVTNVLSNHEDYVDVGAYDGRVFMRLLEITHNQISSAHLVEPDIKSLELLKGTLNVLPTEMKLKIKIIPLAIANCNGSIQFSHGFDMASRVCEIRSKLTSCGRMNDLCMPMSFLKIHIEGGEYNALLGGLSIILRHRPIITATIYHNRDGLWKTILLLSNNLEGYKFLFRLHSWCGTGAVIYGLPEERILH